MGKWGCGNASKADAVWRRKFRARERKTQEEIKRKDGMTDEYEAKANGKGTRVHGEERKHNAV